jgi:hypothetical protein
MLIIFGTALPVGAGKDNRTGVLGFARGKRETKKSKSEHLQRMPQGKSGCTVLEISFFCSSRRCVLLFWCAPNKCSIYMLECAGKIMTANSFFQDVLNIVSHKHFRISIYNKRFSKIVTRELVETGLFEAVIEREA